MSRFPEQIKEHHYWAETRAKLGAIRDVEEFKTLEVIREIPLYIINNFSEEYFTEVKQLISESPDESKWNAVLRAGEPFDGHTNVSYLEATQFFMDGTTTSSFRLKSMHHVLVAEKMAQRPIEDYDSIVEFGAGIGDTARVCFEKGFKGHYHIIDFDEVAKFSRYYLLKMHEHGKAQGGLLSFHGNIYFDWPKDDTLFLATWSLSETPAELRADVAKKVKGRDHLILFQGQFFGYGNFEYFTTDWLKLVEPSEHSLRQMTFQIHDGGNWYFFGQP